MSKYFWFGWTCCACLTSFIQDFYGKTKYMEIMDRSWANTPAWMWPLIVVGYYAMIKIDEKFLSKPKKKTLKAAEHFVDDMMEAIKNTRPGKVIAVNLSDMMNDRCDDPSCKKCHPDGAQA